MTEDLKQTKYERYVEELIEDIAETIQLFGCQPILFIGSGLPRRYFGAPSWDELLGSLAKGCPTIEKGLGFYQQSFKTPQRVGEEFARLYQEWAWSGGKNQFPADLFNENVGSQSYIKFKIAELFKKITPQSLEELLKSPLADEIKSLQSIKPHALITTNYDEMIELIFPDHHPIVGQQILKGAQFTVGEVYKIHGCVTDHDSIVFTETDYKEFTRKKKFLGAKLLTFFNEHPLLFIGYSASDPDIRSILSDIDEALPDKGGVIPNVYILQYRAEIDPNYAPAREKVIPTEEGREIRVKLIETNDFSWVFDAFASNPALNDVNVRVLRALIARSYTLVRHDIPKMQVEADFKMLSAAVEDSNSFAKLFGIANISEYSAASAQYPYSPTEVGQALGGKGWHVCNQLIDAIKAKKGVNIRGSDNRYHRSERVNKTPFHKYSPEAIALLKKVQSEQEYEVDMS